jgi:site-specific DNA-methyltransferase (adenine-specific)
LSKKRGRKSKTDTTKDINITKPANTRNEIAAELNVKSTTLYKLQYIDKHIPEFIDKIDEGKLNTDQAYRAIKKSEEDKINRNITAILPTTITTDYYKIFNQSSDDLSELDDESVNCIMTSPPYWMKRTFSNISDELGAEKTSEEYVRNIVEHLNDSYRVLKKDGSFFLNIGDTFKDKCLQLIPYRVAIELQKKGWIIRNSIIWHRNSLPFTTKDNLTSSYEFIFHLVKSKNYFYNEVLLPLKNQSITVNTFARKSGRKCLSDNAKVIIGGLKEGKKLEDYWTCDVVKTAIANQSEVKKYGGTDHAAPFPKEVPILPILQTTRPGDVVLDLFSGSGTTSAVALLLGRKTIAYEVNTNYNQLQINRFDDAIRIYNDHDQAKLAA